MYTCLHLYIVYTNVLTKWTKTNLNPALHLRRDFTVYMKTSADFVFVNKLFIEKEKFGIVGVFILSSHSILSTPLWHVTVTLKHWTCNWSVRSITPVDTVSAGNCPVGTTISATLCSALSALCGSTLVADQIHLVI